MMIKDTYAGTLRKTDVGKEVKLAGWVHTIRDLGSLTFVMLRDRSGEVQIVFDRSKHGKLIDVLDEMTKESVIYVKGVVKAREESTVNPNIPTGEIEVEPSEVKILAKSDVPPFPLTAPEDKLSEMQRLQYRYIDLRRPTMRDMLRKRHEATMFIRNYLSDNGFWEIETPYLTKYTPGGARNFMVPSHNPIGTFYALAESPQIFKQLLMIGGVEKYFQIARCFRDEELRADRQPEFTQIDIEMSFIDEEDIRHLIEPMLAGLLEKLTGYQVETPFRVMTYEEAMHDYGSDKPDLRNPLKLVYLNDVFGNTGVKFIASALEKGDNVVGIIVPAIYSKSFLKNLEKELKAEGAGGLLWFMHKDGELVSTITKFLSDEEKQKLLEVIPEGHTYLGVVGEYPKANEIVGRLRNRMANELGLVKDGYEFLWVVEFPLFEVNDDGSIKAAHHPFTMPIEEDIPLLDKEPLKVRAKAYDIVLNGYEIGGGSIRIHDRDLQKRIFEILQFSDIDGRFEFFLRAFNYGAPPHGGIALGLDRILMVMLGKPSIREVIAFPKSKGGACPLTGAPAPLYDDQYKDFMEIAKAAKEVYENYKMSKMKEGDEE
ncbi:aspartate--tRNA ligase [bacterium 3DAC]|jgi:aspartyl-tRNA synthetase|nr:aspartate--tRNA ligase [Dictyoglomota bacterium]UZN23208.1 aspartate--tRNA ligase [bacterium 3DAC]